MSIEITGASLPPGVVGDVQGQLCIEVLHAPEKLRFRWWGMADFSPATCKRPPSNSFLSHRITTSPGCFASYIRDSKPTVEIGRENGQVLTSIHLRPFLRGNDLFVDSAFPLTESGQVHLRITMFWNAQLAHSFEQNEQLARDLVDHSVEKATAKLGEKEKSRLAENHTVDETAMISSAPAQTRESGNGLSELTERAVRLHQTIARNDSSVIGS